MSLSRTLLLGFVAGVTILLGLPVGRLRRPAPGLRVFLNATAVGILVFLVWDVLSAAWEPVDSALSGVHEHTGGLRPVFGYGALFVAGLAVGLLGLVGYEAWMRRRTTRLRRNFGPGAMAAGELSSGELSSGELAAGGLPVGGLPAGGLRRDGAGAGGAPRGIAGWSAARQLALLIAVGIGLHNFAEGLAIGQSAANGDVALATLLVIGFGLHNATEGFGIVAPLAAGEPADRPSWGFLAGLGLIGGGPTFAGAALGHGFTSDPLSVVFLTLAAGSILYVVIQLISLAAKAGRQELLAGGILLGLVAGFVTDAIVSAAGA